MVVCDTAKVRFFKQITTNKFNDVGTIELFAILQKYDFSSKSQLYRTYARAEHSCLRYCKSTIFQANHNLFWRTNKIKRLFAILQKYDFSSKSQLGSIFGQACARCLRYCKSTIFQANHNSLTRVLKHLYVVCDTAKVRFFKQITTSLTIRLVWVLLFAILQKYDFSSKSQPTSFRFPTSFCCLRYCKSTIFQANHNKCIK